MAIVQLNLLSEALMRTVNLTAILPSDKKVMPWETKPEDKPFKSLYLLHGILGSNMDWLSGTNIQQLAEANNLAVFMPSGENMFYVDQPKAHNYYGQFIGEELPELMKKTFNISHDREDTFIAGLSMGGYGAVRNGLKYSKTFSHIGGFSCAFITDNINDRTNEMKTPFYADTRDYAEAVFGDLTKVEGSDMDPRALAKKAVEKGTCPKIFLACGEQDFLYDINKEMVEYFKSTGISVDWMTAPGNHEWDFWQRAIVEFIKTLPTDGITSGISSGNIGK